MTRPTAKGKEHMKETPPSKEKPEFDEWKYYQRLFEEI